MKILYPNVPYSDIPRLAKEGKIKVGTKVKACEDEEKYPNGMCTGCFMYMESGTVNFISDTLIEIKNRYAISTIYFHKYTRGFLDIISDEEEEKPIYQVGVDMGSKEGDRTVRVIVELKPLSFSEPLTKEARWWEHEPYKHCLSNCGCTNKESGHDGTCAWRYDIPQIIAEVQRRERKRILQYQHGFIRFGDHGEIERAPEYGVIDDLLTYLNKLSNE